MDRFISIIPQTLFSGGGGGLKRDRNVNANGCNSHMVHELGDFLHSVFRFQNLFGKTHDFV